MSIWTVLLDIVILLGVGALLGGLFVRMRQSAIVGYLLAGVLLGPNVFHVIQSGEEVIAVSELGVALLLFAIGLEFSWPRLRGMGRIALGSGVFQIVVTTLLGASVAWVAGLSLAASVAIGAMCALSSTACVLRVLTARGEVESVHSERALGVLLMQDIAVVPLVMIVTLLATGGTAEEVFFGLIKTAGIGLALVAAMYVVFYHLVPRLLASGPVHSNRELPLLIAIVSGLGSGVVAHTAGVSPALGAFVAGLLLAGSPFAVQIRADVSSLKVLLLTLFFTAMGMLADPVWIASNALLVGSVVAAIVLGKTAIVFVSLRIFGVRGQTALGAGLCLAQMGEFSFVLADIARGNILDESMFMLIISVTVITMVLTPYLVTNAPVLAARLTRNVTTIQDEGPEAMDGECGIVIGFGPAGRAVAERIAEMDCHVVIIDQNPTAAREARALGYGAVTGDACHAEVLEHAGLRRATLVMVTVPVSKVALDIVRYVREQVPEVPILVRARFHRALTELQDAGAAVVIDEEHEVGRLLARAYKRMLKRGEESPPPASG
jgi:CPA2 family monovalent cation:H+ antiporter-2